jgi:hypothetical protein
VRMNQINNSTIKILEATKTNGFKRSTNRKRSLDHFQRDVNNKKSLNKKTETRTSKNLSTTFKETQTTKRSLNNNNNKVWKLGPGRVMG